MPWWSSADWLTVKVVAVLFALACLGGIYNQLHRIRRLIEESLRRPR